MATAKETMGKKKVPSTHIQDLPPKVAQPGEEEFRQVKGGLRADGCGPGPSGEEICLPPPPRTSQPGPCGQPGTD
jgi:hypothetical protein